MPETLKFQTAAEDLGVHRSYGRECIDVSPPLHVVQRDAVSHALAHKEGEVELGALGQKRCSIEAAAPKKTNRSACPLKSKRSAVVRGDDDIWNCMPQSRPRELIAGRIRVIDQHGRSHIIDEIHQASECDIEGRALVDLALLYAMNGSC